MFSRIPHPPSLNVKREFLCFFFPLMEHTTHKMAERGMRMGLLTWIVFGALAGWVASIIMKKNSEMGAIANIVVGVIGAGLGGWIASLFGLGTVSGFNIYSLLISVAGACVLLIILGMFQKTAKQ